MKLNFDFDKLPPRFRHKFQSRGFVSEALLFIILSLVFVASLMFATGPAYYSPFRRNDAAIYGGEADPGSTQPNLTTGGVDTPLDGEKSVQLHTFAILTLTPTPIRTLCTGTPTDSVIIFDRSSAMSGRMLQQAKAAAKGYIDTIAKNPTNRVAVIAYDRQAQIIADLSSNFPGTKLKIDQITTGTDACIQCGILSTNQHLQTNKLPGRRNFAILLSNGIPTHINGTQTVLAEALPRTIAEAVTGYTTNATSFHTIGYGGNVYTHTLQRISGETDGFYQYAPTEDDFSTAFGNIAQNVCQEPGTNVAPTSEPTLIPTATPVGQIPTITPSPSPIMSFAP